MKKLKGRLAVITGAAQGIGLGIARSFASEGANLLLVDLQMQALTAAAEELRKYSGAVECVVGDITKPEITAQIEQAACEMGSPNILVNNAGIGAAGTIEDFDDDGWNKVIALNLTAPFQITKRIIPYMVQNRYGRIINISSMNSMIGMRKDSAYAASKSGLNALTRSVAVDYGVYGITSNAIAPGPIKTPLNREILDSQPAWFLKTVVDNKPVPGFGEPSDIGAIATFLASEESGFISGQIIAVDGGLSATRFVSD